MANTHLNWSRMDWVRLQKMTIPIATNRYSDYRFEQYLKNGNKLEGGKPGRIDPIPPVEISLKSLW